MGYWIKSGCVNPHLNTLRRYIFMLTAFFIYLSYMNKARRHELKMLKYKKRLKQLGLKQEPNCNYFAYRSHGQPCSCYMCSPNKYNRAKTKRNQASKTEKVWITIE